MASRATQAPITVEQYENFAGYPGLRDELIYGEIVLSPQPKPLHQQVVENIQLLLVPFVERKSYVAKQNSNIRFALANSMPAPDVFVLPAAVWRQACLEDDYIAVPPLLVVEVLSPANRKAPVARKVQLYLENGVGLVLEVRPKSKTVVTHAAGQPSALLQEGDSLELPDEIAGTIAVSSIFTI